MRIAPHTVYGVDGVGVRRRVTAGQPIPPGLKIDTPLPAADNAPAEQKLLNRRKANRAAAPKPEETSEYDDMKRPELFALLKARGLEYPKGAVKSTDLVKLLREADARAV